MIIYTNSSNPLALKLLIVAKLAKKNVELKIVNLNDPAINEPRHLPCLQLDDGTQFFMTDAAVKYLMNDIEEDSNTRSQWLEWSTTRLAPALAQKMSVGHRVDQNANVALNSLVCILDDTLAESSFITGDKVSSADIAIWCLLTPNATLDGSHNIEHVLRWYRVIENLPEVKESLDIVGSIKNLNFSSLLQCNRFGGLHHVELIPHIADLDSKVLAETPSMISETILPIELELAIDSFVYESVQPKSEPRTVLPKANERNILITSALPYVNNVPHLGNIIGCVLSADIYARYSRMCGYNTLFVCGTDEYGTATETKALSENLTCRQICDKYFEIHNSIYRWFGIGFDFFGRTTTNEQTEIVQNLFLDLYNQGLIETQAVEQLLCQKCDRFLADRFVEGTCPHPGCGYEDARGDQCDKCGKLINAIELIRPRCKVCNSAPIARQSDQLFLNLPKIEPDLRKWIDTVDNQWTNNAKTITKSWLKEGLKTRCITRDLKWGIPVPLAGFENKVFYVWFDAPIGYISITSKYTKDWREWWQPNDKSKKVELFQFMAKDNVPFHSVMFPSTLIGVNKGHTLVSRIVSTEYLNYESGKFSKSRGVGVFGNDAQNTGIESDIWRFYLASIRPEGGQDSCFSWDDLAARNNSELLNNLGNFINRALMFCEKNFKSTISKITLNSDDTNLLALINREYKGYILSMEKIKYRDAIRHLLGISRHGNLYLQTEQPWVLLKGTDEQKTRAGSVISLACNITCLLSKLLFPFMPATSRKIQSQLNIDVNHILFSPSKPQMSLLLKAGHIIGKPAPIFTKIEQTDIDKFKKKYAGEQTRNVDTKAVKTVAELEKAVEVQGNKIRELKKNKIDKSVLQPEINILLALKKELEELKTSCKSTNIVEMKTSKTVAELEKAVEVQGNKIRELKKNKVDKSVLQPEINILLALKKELEELKTSCKSTSNVVVVTSKTVEELEKAVEVQGNKIRELKKNKIEKSILQPEINILLALKKELEEAKSRIK